MLAAGAAAVLSGAVQTIRGTLLKLPTPFQAVAIGACWVGLVALLWSLGSVTGHLPGFFVAIGIVNGATISAALLTWAPRSVKPLTMFFGGGVTLAEVPNALKNASKTVEAAASGITSDPGLAQAIRLSLLTTLAVVAAVLFITYARDPRLRQREHEIQK